MVSRDQGYYVFGRGSIAVFVFACKCTTSSIRIYEMLFWPKQTAEVRTAA